MSTKEIRKAKVFVSHAREQKRIAEDIAVRLRAEGFDPFLDRDSLKAGEEFDKRIQNEVWRCDIFLFLVSPASVSTGSYTCTELLYAADRWQDPSGRVLPAIVEETALQDIPSYLRRLTLLVPEGNIVVSIVSRVREMLLTERALVIPTDPEAAAESQSSVSDHVDQLVRALSDLRQARRLSHSVQSYEVKVDGLVAKIKQVFKPMEGVSIAGAELVRVIGNGNFGTVWEAVRNDGTAVAVKVFHLNRLTEGHMLSMFRRSVRAMRILTEEKSVLRKADPRGSIVPFHEADPSQLAFSMKLLIGGDLEDMDRLGWTLKKKIEVMLSICAAVEYSHSLGVIHRDIKPANVVLDEHGKAVLTDFDIADIKFSTRLSTTVEKSLGTPVFAAPEQLADASSATEVADVYSLGRLFYFFLLERSPGYEVERDPSLENLGNQPPALVEVVRRATQYDSQKRYPSVTLLILALEGSQTGAAAWWARLSRIRRWVRGNWAALAIMVLVAATGSGFAIYQRQTAAMERNNARTQERLRQEAEESKVRAEAAVAALTKLGGELEETRKESLIAGERLEARVMEVEILQNLYDTMRDPEVARELAAAKERVEDAKNAVERIERQREGLAARLRDAQSKFKPQTPSLEENPGRAPEERSADELIGELHSASDFRLRMQAALELRRYGAISRVELERALSDENSAVRAATVASLRSIGDPQSLPALRKLENDSSQAVQNQVKAAIDALERSGILGMYSLSLRSAASRDNSAYTQRLDKVVTRLLARMPSVRIEEKNGAILIEPVLMSLEETKLDGGVLQFEAKVKIIITRRGRGVVGGLVGVASVKSKEVLVGDVGRDGLRLEAIEAATDSALSSIDRALKAASE